MQKIFQNDKVKFILGGGFNTIFSVVIFLASDLFFNELISLTLSFWCTFFVSYFVYSYVFRSKNRFLRFSVAVIVAYLFQQLVGFIGLRSGLSGIYIFVLVSVFHVPFYFLLLKHFTFRDR